MKGYLAVTLTVTDNTNYFPLIILNSAAKLLAGAEWSGESGREQAAFMLLCEWQVGKGQTCKRRHGPGLRNISETAAASSAQ